MAVTGITTYQPTTTSSVSKKGGNSMLNMDDFFKLLTAQLSNQDMSNLFAHSLFSSYVAVNNS